MALSNNFIELLRPFIKQAQEIENVLNDLKLFRSINNSEGAQLDSLGDILDVERDTGEGDISYRIRLQLKIVENRSNGEPEVIIDFVKDTTNSNDVEYRAMFPAGVGLTIDGLDMAVPADKTLFGDILQLTQPLLAAGVKLREIVLINPNLDPFVTGDDGAFASVGEGFLEKGFDEVTNGYKAGAFAEKA